MLEEGDFIRINYTGMIKESGKVFDTTSEEIAKKHGIYDEKLKFKAVPVVLGAGHVIRGLDEALIGVEVGEKKTVEIPPEKGFGLRDPKLVKILPMGDFKKRGLRPYPGMRIEADNMIGKVQSVSGGRVRVDFNSELAGKVLKYEVSVEEKINKPEEKIRLLLERYFPYAEPEKHKITISGKKATIILADAAKVRDAHIGKNQTAKDIFKFMEVDEVEFLDLFKKQSTVDERSNIAEARA
jgi:FKBP-type peptidyl-prolyl cis-trans isomerase 2